MKDVLKNFILFLMFLVFLICKNETNQKISSYIMLTKEVNEFCSVMIPCIKEEISNTFKDLPQQKEYLLSKTNIQNCQSEQGSKLDELLNLSNEQISIFYQKISNKDLSEIDPSYLTLNNLYMIVSYDQKLILEAFILCKENVLKTTDCSEKKNIIKNNEHCLKIFSYKSINNP